jgi:hypothetical protein
MEQGKEGLEWEGWDDWTWTQGEQQDDPGGAEWMVLRDDDG